MILTAMLAGCEDPNAAWIEGCAHDSAAADRALARHDDPRALRHLESIVSRPTPPRVAARDVRIIQQDAFDRMAQIHMRRGDPVAALGVVNRALALGVEDDVTSANLLTTRGRIYEAQSRDEEAARDYHRALEITERMLDRTLEGR